jgi:predicted HNH restriction endonuclease
MDDIDNGICLCADCHTKVHTGEIILQLPLRMGSAINA